MTVNSYKEEDIFVLSGTLKNQNIKNLENYEDIIRVNSEAQYGCPYTFTYTFDEISNTLNKYNMNKLYIKYWFNLMLNKIKS